MGVGVSDTHDSCDIFIHVELCLNCLRLLAVEERFSGWWGRQFQTSSHLNGCKTRARAPLRSKATVAVELPRSRVQETKKNGHCARSGRSDLDR